MNPKFNEFPQSENTPMKNHQDQELQSEQYPRNPSLVLLQSKLCQGYLSEVIS